MYIYAIHQAAEISNIKLQCGLLKPNWNEELDRLKEDCIFWHQL
jgi:hypothetical protein